MHRFLAELSTYCTSQPGVSKVAVGSLCNSSVVIMSSHFLPCFFDRCLLQAESKGAGIRNGDQVHKGS